MVIHFLYFYQKNYARKDKGKFTQSEQSRTIITSDFKCSLTFM